MERKGLIMKKREYVFAFSGILLILGGIFYYQIFHVVKEVEFPVVEEQEEEERLEGFEEPEETVAYLVAQMEAGNLDGALRCCAVDNVAKYFNLTAYLEYTEDFRGVDMIPAADYDDEAYYDIAKLRIASDFGHMVQSCMNRLSDGSEWKVHRIVRVEPENPDGKYYERLNSISNILGARDVCECTVYMSIDEEPIEIRLSLAKYRRFWEVILFSSMDEYRRENPDIRKSRENFSNEETLDFIVYQDELLPLNYFLIKSQKEADVKTLINNYCIYLQRGDILSALTYYDFGNGEQEPEFSLELLDRQKEAAVCLQELYYEMFLQDTDFEWVKRHYYDNAGYIPECLKTMNMQYVDYEKPEKVMETKNEEYWRIRYLYDGNVYSRCMVLSRLDGWRILKLEY